MNDVSISVPARTSISVIDMNSFGPGIAGGGNIGFAIDCNTIIRIQIHHSDKLQFDQSIKKPRIDELSIFVKHVLKAYRKHNLNYENYFFKITIEKVSEPHIGLASFSSLLFSLTACLDSLTKKKIKNEDLRNFNHNNYIEINEGKVEKGFTTGLSTELNTHGGFGIINSNLNLEFSSKLPDWNVNVLVPYNTKSISFGEIELRALMIDGRKKDFESIGRKKNLLELIKRSVINRDLSEFGTHVYDIQRTGGKVAEINIYGKKIWNILDNLYELGIECAFLSAVGPGIIVLTEKDYNKMNDIYIKLGLNTLHNGKVDNLGYKLYINEI